MIGVVADTRINGLKDDAAMVYLPYWAYTPMTLSFLVRSSQPSDALIPEMRRAIWQIDPQVAIPTLKSMDDQVSDSVAGDRFQAMVLSGFGAPHCSWLCSESMACLRTRLRCAGRSSASASPWVPLRAR